jgi:hypothetical protein
MSDQGNNLRVNLRNLAETAGNLLIDLANLTDEGTAEFLERWRWYRGCDLPTLWNRQSQLRLLWLSVCVQLDAADLPKSLGKEWRTWGRRLDEVDGTESDLPTLPRLEARLCESWLRAEPTHWFVHWDEKKRILYPDTPNLPATLALACLAHADELAYCRNPSCVHPYFLKVRLDQLYCSPECATFGQRQAKRKWWYENRGKGAKAQRGD